MLTITPELPTASIPEPIVIKTKNSVGEILSEFFTCNAHGYPGLSIQWLHNNLDVSSHPDKYLVSQPVTDANQLSSTLQITNLNSRDNGLVSCTASIIGCNPTASRDGCKMQTFTSQSSTTTLSLLSELI